MTFYRFYYTVTANLNPKSITVQSSGLFANRTVFLEKLNRWNRVSPGVWCYEETAEDELINQGQKLIHRPLPFELGWWGAEEHQYNKEWESLHEHL